MKPRRTRTRDDCEIADCTKEFYCKNLCVNHYQLQKNKEPRNYTRTSYHTMINRCNNPKNNRYSEYGGRGIKVCKRWMDSFDNFVADMGLRPRGLTIDRIDSNGDYEPLNCRWADYTTQNRNHRVLKKSKSGVTGVSYEKKRERWVVGIGYNYQYKKIGYFKTLNEAIAARKLAEERYWT